MEKFALTFCIVAFSWQFAALAFLGMILPLVWFLVRVLSQEPDRWKNLALLRWSCIAGFFSFLAINHDAHPVLAIFQLVAVFLIAILGICLLSSSWMRQEQ